jgi:hypothetical protein
MSSLLLLACLPVAASEVPKGATGKIDVQDSWMWKINGNKTTGQTVVLGTWMWTIDGNKLGGDPKADFWWQQVNDKERFLVPMGGAQWAILKGKAFAKVTAADLGNAAYSGEKLPGKLLTPGVVVVVRTAGGKVAKLEVLRYRELHDFAFPEAKHLTPAWRAFALTRPNTKEYHLEVRWVLYHGEK